MSPRRIKVRQVESLPTNVEDDNEMPILSAVKQETEEVAVKEEPQDEQDSERSHGEGGGTWQWECKEEDVDGDKDETLFPQTDPLGDNQQEVCPAGNRIMGDDHSERGAREANGSRNKWLVDTGEADPCVEAAGASAALVQGVWKVVPAPVSPPAPHCDVPPGTLRVLLLLRHVLAHQMPGCPRASLPRGRVQATALWRVQVAESLRRVQATVLRDSCQAVWLHHLRPDLRVPWAPAAACALPHRREAVPVQHVPQELRGLEVAGDAQPAAVPLHRLLQASVGQHSSGSTPAPARPLPLRGVRSRIRASRDAEAAHAVAQRLAAVQVRGVRHGLPQGGSAGAPPPHPLRALTVRCVLQGVTDNVYDYINMGREMAGFCV
ncbi:uncharacterized protein [Periplaneta americana]|uniref:uncharacterized protein isoform X2 n=1 Tax=Periplaneta americana TaxID=6978 RepID=UPI0037E977A5